jgi:hypothetical protein
VADKSVRAGRRSALTTDAPSRTGQGGLKVTHQVVEFVVWLGIAVLGVIWANLSLWHARRLLSQSQPGKDVQEVRFVSSAIAESASSVIAP